MTMKSLSYSVAGLAMVMTMPALAQTTAATAVMADDTIVVTARKRAEDVQTVPIVIESYTAQALTERNINTLADLAANTPGLAINTIAGGALVTVYIRGQAPAVTTSDLNTEANVGVFIDGIYQTSRDTLDIISVLDIGQLDVVKGPQSALYGRSTFAGTLGIFTPAPARELSGRIEGTVGTNEDYRVRGSISGPVIGDKLFARVSGGYLNFGGTAENLTTPDNNQGGYEKYAISGSLELDLDRFTARLNAFATHSKSEVSGIRLPLLSEYNCGVVEPVTGANTLFCGDLISERVNDVSGDMPLTTFSTQQVSLDLQYESDAFTLVSVTGLTQSKNRTFNDYDGSGLGIPFGVCTRSATVTCGFGPPQPYNRIINVNVHTSGRAQVRTFSQELRLQSPDKNKFQWMLGGFYFNSRIPTSYNPAVDLHAQSGSYNPANEVLLQVVPTNLVTGRIDFTALTFRELGKNIYGATSDTVASTRTFSAFGSLGYDFGQVRVSAEGRYNVDKKRSRLDTGTGVQPVDGPNANLVFATKGVQQAATFKSFTPRFTIDYRPTDNVFFYASAAKGVRSGGFNNQSLGAAVLPEEIFYEEEENWTYEVGVKSNLLDNRLMLNLSAFRVDWSNMQISVFSENTVAMGIPTAIVANAGQYRVEGVEGNIELRPSDMFGIGGAFNFSNPRFIAGSYDTTRRGQCILPNGTAVPPCVATTITAANGTPIVVPDLTGLRTSRSVRTSWNLHATANIPVGNDWEATGRIDLNHTGNAPIDLINSSFIPSRTLTNLRFGLDNGKYSIAVFATNVFDKIFAQNAIVQPRAGIPSAIRPPEAVQAERRRIGVTAAARF